MSESETLAQGLREAGHEDLAAALERKRLGDELRKFGRDDLADALDTAEAEPKPPAAEPNANKQEAAAIVGALQAAGAWPHDEAA